MSEVGRGRLRERRSERCVLTLTKQEARCVFAACGYLADRFGGAWEIVPGPTLDEQFPETPSPEVIVSNGEATAAVEVKGLHGDSEYLAYSESLTSLARSLAPPGGGHFVLNPAPGVFLPLDLRTRRVLRREIERVAPALGPGDQGVVRIPRSGTISVGRETGAAIATCMHNSAGGLLAQIESAMGAGSLLLVDEAPDHRDLVEHSFITEEARSSFVESVLRAWRKRLAEGSAEAEWFEEWQLFRGEDGEGSVDVIATTRARNVSGANQEAVDLVLDSAVRKFEQRRWADHHLVVFDRLGIMLSEEYLLDALASYSADDFANVEIILITDGESVVEAWSSPLAGAG